MSSSHGLAIPGTMASEVEVLAKATRRRFSAEYKKRFQSLCVLVQGCLGG